MGNFLFLNRIINNPRFTWYPESIIDIEFPPKTIGCPVVDKQAIKLWRAKGYIGMMVKSVITKKGVQLRYVLTDTDSDNCACMLKKGIFDERFRL